MPSSPPDYDRIASFYDPLLGTDLFGTLIKNYLSKNYKKDSSVLELGCGTGSNLAILAPIYKVTGIDISGKMLSIAKKKLPGSEFYKQDITNFKVKKNFDVILSLYDTINHIKGLNNWERIFKNVKKHLRINGVFIFDINTLYKLNFLYEQPASVISFDRNYMIMNITKYHSVKEQNKFNWNMKIFDYKKNKYSLTENTIPEYGYEITEINERLSKYFKSIKILNSEFKKAGKYSDRVFFICKN